MRVKINGKDLNPGDRVTFESSEYSDGQGLVVLIAGIIAGYLWWRGFL
ncbi:hypothetical protein [Paenibacillus sedimenti]|uniref:Uncharacterized protein n=1 Tax=Paenibacillus sedimenti TaxID=2770274 RepID=A0A926KQU9_9BACL|nr:hypothetical protein [Paenibacillus sedimenti]MBD0381246.1 hypothetical protein [Paenibacillus sedimenti]